MARVSSTVYKSDRPAPYLGIPETREMTTFTQVPVSTDDLDAVMAFLLDRHAVLQSATPPVSSREQEGEGKDARDVVGSTDKPISPWTVDELKRFASTDLASANTVGRVLDVLATGEPEDPWFSTTRLVELTGVPRNNLKGAFAALTRHLSRHYPDHGWMLKVKWGSHFEPKRTPEGYYSLDAEQRQQWKQARAA
jgi:hypothetical protein